MPAEQAPIDHLARSEEDIIYRLAMEPSATASDLLTHIHVKTSRVYAAINRLSENKIIAREGSPVGDGKAGRPPVRYSISEEAKPRLEEYLASKIERLTAILTALRNSEAGDPMTDRQETSD